ncbi:hypothetical protein [Limnoglobus roseus]|uniref:Uncharacterized protein n=1 Tax=Limnoglobus roseus TaxID=2598579 RepID=A0A5C1AGJ7_9BACT|nr:hypothetical protein [Limnoglobus roseus]QEL18331.1 hypothetical protein PX52LOC_05352 [Limnoglobus roseus]
MFAKLFGPPERQILCVLDSDPETAASVIRVSVEPPGLGVCSINLGYGDTEDGIARAKQSFVELDEAKADSLARPIFEMAAKLRPHPTTEEKG